jgi:hypothetical protein
MATIDQRDNVFTSINVFTVKPENQDTLVNLVIEATNNTMRHLPGFVSTSIHRSPDNTRVVNCAQWRPKANSTPCALIPTRIPTHESGRRTGIVRPDRVRSRGVYRDHSDTDSSPGLDPQALAARDRTVDDGKNSLASHAAWR